MPLPSSITLNVGSPAANVIYDDISQINGASVVYSAPSPRSDLLGRPTLKISHETSAKSGLVRTLVSLITPIWDSTLSKYDGFTKTDFVINRNQRVPLQLVTDEVEKMSELLAVADVRAAITKALL
jgi:hypothetical protein